MRKLSSILNLVCTGIPSFEKEGILVLLVLINQINQKLNVGGAPAPEDSQFCCREMTKLHSKQLLRKLKGNRLESLSSAIEFFILEAFSRVSHERNSRVFCHHALMTDVELFYMCENA